MCKVENIKVVDLFLGNATFTIENSKTKNRFTFKIKELPKKYANNKEIHFISVLSGSDNDSDYRFFGTVFDKNRYSHSKKSKITEDAQSVLVFKYLLSKMNSALPECINIYHKGKCLRCGRTLTVPESIVSGFGPECIKYV